MKTPKLLVFVLALLLLFGCGGGGSGLVVVGPSTLLYRTDWSKRAQPGGGLSQRVTLIDSEGRAVRSLAANFSVDGLEDYPIEDLPSGTYLVRVELFSQQNLTGVVTGTLQALVTVSGSTLFTTAVGETATGVQVFPQNATIAIPESEQFYAAAADSAGRLTFTQGDAFDWQVFGGVGTVNDHGLVLSSSAGQGSVRATHTASTTQGSALLTVQPSTTETTKWTVMVFLNAANDLFSFSPLNVNQMEKVADNPDVRFVVQWKQSTDTFGQSSFNTTRRYLVRPDQTDSIASRVIQDLGVDVDMGRPQTLNEFITWTKTYYPAERYALIVWNHGNGWRRKPDGPKAVSYDDHKGTSIQIWELKQALTGHQLDILAWDSSLMQMLEVAYEVRDNTAYVVGSEESPPGEGYPYDSVFAQFRDNPTGSTSNLAKAFVDGMVNHPPYVGRKITQSVIDSSKLDALATAANNLAVQLIANNAGLQADIPVIRNSAQAYSQTTSPPRYYRDLWDIANRLEGLAGFPTVQAAASGVKAAIEDAVIWEGHNAQSPGSRGISIDFTPGSAFLPAASDYARMEFAQVTQWNEWLQIAP